MDINIEGKSAEEIFALLQLDEHCLYKVGVKTTKENVKHRAFLFTGFKTGAYCVVYNNSYEAPVPMQSLYSIELILELDSELNNNFIF